MINDDGRVTGVGALKEFLVHPIDFLFLPSLESIYVDPHSTQKLNRRAG
jgi:hypothetical protein